MLSTQERQMPHSFTIHSGTSSIKLTIDEIRAAPDAEYMSKDQLEFFHDLLMAQRSDALDRLARLQTEDEGDSVESDPTDRASQEEARSRHYSLQARDQKLIRDIDSALTRIKNEEYGYCTQTGEEIGIGRLLARPEAPMSVHAQQIVEVRQRMASAA